MNMKTLEVWIWRITRRTTMKSRNNELSSSMSTKIRCKSNCLKARIFNSKPSRPCTRKNCLSFQFTSKISWASFRWMMTRNVLKLTQVTLSETAKSNLEIFKRYRFPRNWVGVAKIQIWFPQSITFLTLKLIRGFWVMTR